MKRSPFLAAFALTLATLGASPAAGVPAPESTAGAEAEERISTLLSLGLTSDAERLLQDRLPEGLDWVRSSALRLYVRTGQVESFERRVREWGGVDSLGTAANHFVWGRLQELQSNWEAAGDAYAASAASEPLLADHAAYRAARMLARTDRSAAALDLYERAGASARGSNLSATAYWRAAQTSLEQGDPDRALANLERVPRRSVISRSDLLDLESQIYRAQGETEREVRVLREMVDRVPSAARSIAAVDRLLEMREPTLTDRISFAEVALRNRHASLAERYAREVLDLLKASPDADLEGRARLKLGKALVQRKHYTKAREELDLMPAGARAEERAEALLDRARCLWRLGQIDACLAEYDAVADGPWDDEVRATALWEAGREAKDNRRWEEAAVRLGEFQRLYPDNDYADDAAWHRGRALSELGRSEEAVAALAVLRARYPDSPFAGEAAYWTADLRRRMGDEEGACVEYADLLSRHPDSYWSERARVRLAGGECPAASGAIIASEQDPVDWLAGLLPAVDTSEARERVRSIEDSDRFRRARLLAATGLLAEAETELGNLRASFAKDTAALLMLAERAWLIGVPREAMRAILVVKSRTGKPILSGDMPAPVARLLYPVDHLDVVLRWSREHDLDPWFVFAVMREESWFQADVVSWAGAHGLMQIMPSTGRDLARRVGMSGFRQSDLFRPEVNIRLGTYYLSSLLDDLDREPAMALSAYNAGKGNALRWRKSVGPDFDVDRYVAGITYRETYGYVQKVTRSWAIYRHLYGDLLDSLENLSDAVK